jgi:opacity protein-like surface antigen
MKRSLTLALLGVAVLSGAAHAATTKAVSVGVFVGSSVPVLQDVSTSSFSTSDAFGDAGSQFGLRVSAVVIPVVTLEPYYAKSSYSDRTETFSGIRYTREGFDGKTFGMNAILGRVMGGVKFFPYVGISKSKLERTGQEINKTGYNFGLGLGIAPAEKFSIQVRGEFAMVATGDTSRKFANATFGLNYALLP